MKILFCFTVFIANLVSAKDVIIKYAIFGKDITFYSNEVLPVTSSKPCKITSDKASCLNFQFLRKASLKKIARMPAGNPNTGAIICEDQLGGVSVIGLDSAQNQRSFCYLNREGIYIGNGTILYFARKNDNVESTETPFDIRP